MEFEAIPGVGPKTAAALAEFDGAEQALRDGDVAALARVSNLSEGRAARVARGAIRYRHDDQSEFLTTDRAKELYREILGLLKDRAVTEYATKRMSTFYPTASQARIEEVREQVTAATELDPTFRFAMRSLSWHHLKILHHSESVIDAWRHTMRSDILLQNRHFLSSLSKLSKTRVDWLSLPAHTQRS